MKRTWQQRSLDQKGLLVAVGKLVVFLPIAAIMFLLLALMVTLLATLTALMLRVREPGCPVAQGSTSARLYMLNRTHWSNVPMYGRSKRCTAQRPPVCTVSKCSRTPQLEGSCSWRSTLTPKPKSIGQETETEYGKSFRET